MLRPHEHDPATPMAKLAEADRHLLAIGAEVATLREELARLREEAGERAELLAEREVVIAELSRLLPTLEEARTDALRQAEDASAALTRSEARLSEQAGRFAELQRQLATVDANNAAHERVVAELEGRLAAERVKGDGSERALAGALARAQSAERSLGEARDRFEGLSGDHERLLAEREEERTVAERQAEVTSAAVRASESRLSREAKRVETLERELGTLEPALAERVVRLSELEAELAEARSEHEEVKAVGTDPPMRSAELSSRGHLRFVLRVGGYTMTECDGEPPQPGQPIELDGQRFTVAKVGPSPLPRDLRPCAYLMVENARDEAN